MFEINKIFTGNLILDPFSDQPYSSVSVMQLDNNPYPTCAPLLLCWVQIVLNREHETFGTILEKYDPR